MRRRVGTGNQDRSGIKVFSNSQAINRLKPLVPRGLEPRTLRLLAVRSNQLSYETLHKKQNLPIIRFDTPESN